MRVDVGRGVQTLTQRLLSHFSTAEVTPIAHHTGVRVAFPDRMPGFGESLTHLRMLQEDHRLNALLKEGFVFSRRSVKASGKAPRVYAFSQPQGLDPTAAHTRASLANQLRR